VTEPASPRGKFITFEGGEGCGKSTQSRLLVETLRAEGRAIVATREPGGSPGAELIRALLVEGEPGRWDALTEMLLMTAARRDHVENTIRPALDAGSWVVCDRFIDSTIAYQGYGGGVDLGFIARVSSAVVSSVRPDLTIVLDIPVELGLARAKERAGGEDRFERKGIEFHRRLRNGYLEIAMAEPERCAVIPAEGDVAAVARRVRATVTERLGIAAAS
jgi:dTMP kinase